MSISSGESLRKKSARRAIFVRRPACSPTRCEVSTRSASSVGPVTKMDQVNILEILTDIDDLLHDANWDTLKLVKFTTVPE